MAIDDFLEELKDCMVEHSFTSRWSLIEGYHLVGKLLVEQGNQYGKNIVGQAAEAIGKSDRTVRYAMSFYQRYNSLDDLPDGKDISWNRIIKRLEGRPEKEEKKVKVIKCPYCERTWEK